MHVIVGVVSIVSTFVVILQGREPGAQIDPWEDPSLEVYHVTDRYGFIQYVHVTLIEPYTCIKLYEL